MVSNDNINHDSNLYTIDSTVANHEYDGLEKKTLFFSQNLDVVLLDRYRLVKKIGSGGMGEIFQGFDLQNNNKEVAIKHLFNGDPISKERFEREYQLLKIINHPSFAQAYDYFEYSGDFFMVLEFVHGQNLKAILDEKTRPFSLGNQLLMAMKIARAIDVINKKGIIHRDIKPDNIMIDVETKDIKLLDLGIGRNLNEKSNLTQTGSGLGSVAYMSPEALDDSPCEKSDIFSLGVTLYQFFSWETISPFFASSYFVTAMNIVEKDPSYSLLDKVHEFNPNLSKEDEKIYQELSDILLRAMNKKPQDRWKNCGLIADRLIALHSTWLREQNRILKGKTSESGTNETEEVANPSSNITPSHLDGDLLTLEELKNPDLIGRDDIVSNISNILQTIPIAPEKFILLNGEDGIGKSRIISETLATLPKNNLLIFQETYDKDSEMQPFLAAMQILFFLYKNLGILPREHYMPECPVEINPNFIEIALSAQGENNLTDIYSGMNQHQEQCFASANCYIRGHAKRRPLCLILDNIHNLDRRSADWLQSFLLSLKRDDSICIIGTYKGDDIAGENNVQRILPNLRARKNFQEIQITPLLNRNISLFLKSMLGTVAISSEDLVLIFQATEGKPYLIIDFIRNLVKAKRILWKEEAWNIEIDKEILTKPSQALESQLINKIDELGINHRRILEWLAVAEFPLPFDILCSLTGFNSTQLPYLLGDLLKQKYLVEQDERESKTYTFSSDNIATSISEQLLPKTKQAMHLELGKQLEKVKNNLSLYRRAATNYQLAEDYKRAIAVYCDCARKYWEEKQFSQIVFLYRNALELARQIHFKNLCALLIEFASRLNEMGDYQQALDLYEESIPLATKSQLEEVKKGKGISLFGLRQYDKAQTELKTFIISQRQEDIEIQLTMASVELSKYNLPKAQQYLDKAQLLLKKCNSNNAMALYKKCEALLKFYKGEWKDAEALFDEAEQLCLGLPTKQTLMEILFGRSWLTNCIYGSHLALDAILSVLTYAQEAEDFYLEFQSHFQAGVYSLDQGKLKQAQKYFDELTQINQKQPLSKNKGYELLGQGWCSLYIKRDYTESEQLILKALSTANECGEAYVSAEAYATLGQIYRRTKQYKKAHQYLNFSKKIFTNLGLVWKANRIATVHARIYTLEKMSQTAYTMLQEAEKYAISIGDNYYLADSYFETGFLCGRNRKVPEAIEFFKKAEELYTKMGRLTSAQDAKQNIEKCATLIS